MSGLIQHNIWKRRHRVKLKVIPVWMHATATDVLHSLPITVPTTTISPVPISCAQPMMPDLLSQVGEKYMIAFRGSAQYLKQNNIQYFTGNCHMTLHDITNLVSELLVDRRVFELICFCQNCPSVTSQLLDSITLPPLCRLCLPLEDRALHIDALSNNGQLFLFGC